MALYAAISKHDYVQLRTGPSLQWGVPVLTMLKRESWAIVDVVKNVAEGPEFLYWYKLEAWIGEDERGNPVHLYVWNGMVTPHRVLSSLPRHVGSSVAADTPEDIPPRESYK